MEVNKSRIWDIIIVILPLRVNDLFHLAKNILRALLSCFLN